MYVINGIYEMGMDIVAACIDSTDVDLIPEGRFLNLGTERNSLMQYTATYDNPLSIIESLENKYKSLPSLLRPRKIEADMKAKKYTYIFVDMSSAEAIDWTKQRMLLEGSMPEIFEERIIRNEAVVCRHYSDYTITLDDILDGKLIEILSTIVDTPLDEKLYQSWLTLVKYDVPWD